MELFISITGQAATGKTTIAKIIEDALRDKGFKVIQNDIDLTGDVIKPDGWVERNTEGIKGKETTISIDTVGVRRGREKVTCPKCGYCPKCGWDTTEEDLCLFCGGVLGSPKRSADIGVTTDKEIILGMG
jgi:hypothetical protein